jgi:hypothetical protein
LPPGKIKLSVQSNGFKTIQTAVNYDSGRPLRYDSHLPVAANSERVEVTASAPLIETMQTSVRSKKRKDRDEKKAEASTQNAASSYVYDLQKRVAGVLPVRIDVPRVGNSYHFARALVLDEETRVTFSYKTSEKR